MGKQPMFHDATTSFLVSLAAVSVYDRCVKKQNGCVIDYGFPCERAPEILYWWCVTIHILVELLIGRAAKEIISANQKYLTQTWKVTRH